MVELLKCPQEIVRYIFTKLERVDLKNIRLTCKTFGIFGAETLLPAIRVVFTKQSFERLREVSLHRIFSLHVNEIIYEADRLDHYDYQEEWECLVVDPDYLESLGPDALEEMQLMLPDNPMRVCHDYSTHELNRGWKRYKALHREQLDICRQHMDVRELGQAVMRMPRLERITINVGQGLTPGFVSDYFAGSFKEMLVPTGGENALKDSEPPGYRHFLPLLVPFTRPEKYDIKTLHDKRIHLAETLTEDYRVSTLNRLCIGAVSWLCLQQLESVKSFLPMALAKVKTLILAFNTGEVGLGQVGAELEDCAAYLRESDALHEFVSACPSLTKLDLSFGSISPDVQAASLEDIVGKTTWNSLHQVAFRRFNIPEGHFLSFLKRHENTLRDVVLEDMCIRAPPETWSSLLSGVRGQDIPWKRFQTVGALYQKGVEDATFYVNSCQPENGPYAAQMIEDYVMGKSCFDPLTSVTVNEATGETVWHDEWEDVSSDDDVDVIEV